MVVSASARAQPRLEIPPQLEPWVPWVLAELPERDCRHLGGEALCAWPGRLTLDVTDTGGRFAFDVLLDANTVVLLPGSNEVWPQNVQVAEERRYQNYRHDRTLDIRQTQMALKKLRYLQRLGAEEELDLEETIDQTCRNGGEIELVFSPPRKNNSKVLLLMDAGGSMLPYTHVMEQLFSAAHQMTHFKDFQHYYFHNCIYEQVYTDIRMNKKTSVQALLRTLDADYKVILVGDAYMAPEELVEPGGAIYYYYHNSTPGIEWLRRIEAHFKSCIWLNPIPSRNWNRPSIELVRKVFPMYELTLDGLDQGTKHLVRKI
jgi:uncharacterized protein with von Willebrand factor type A (vWA) domain